MTMGSKPNLALVMDKKAPQEDKVIDQLAHSLLASVMSTGVEVRRNYSLWAWEVCARGWGTWPEIWTRLKALKLWPEFYSLHVTSLQIYIEHNTPKGLLRPSKPANEQRNILYFIDLQFSRDVQNITNNIFTFSFILLYFFSYLLQNEKGKNIFHVNLRARQQ